MPSNDTENIYSTEYGGQGAPIPASKISYDNTESGLSATKVQGAIDELVASGASKISYDNTESGLNATKVQGAIDELASFDATLADTYVLENRTVTVTVTADGVKTYDDMFDDLHTALLAAIEELEDDEVLFVNNLYIQSVANMLVNGKPHGYVNSDTTPLIFANSAYITASTVILYSVTINGTNAFSMATMNATPEVTITDKLEGVPANNSIIRLDCLKYKEV